MRSLVLTRQLKPFSFTPFSCPLRSQIATVRELTPQKTATSFVLSIFLSICVISYHASLEVPVSLAPVLTRFYITDDRHRHIKTERPFQW